MGFFKFFIIPKVAKSLSSLINGAILENYINFGANNNIFISIYYYYLEN